MSNRKCKCMPNSTRWCWWYLPWNYIHAWFSISFKQINFIRANQMVMREEGYLASQHQVEVSSQRKERFFRMPVWKQGSNHMNMSQGPTYITGNQIMESQGLRFNSKSWSHKYSDSSQGHFNCSFQKPGIPGSRPDYDRNSAEIHTESSACD